jgi:hypothetical protein
MRVVVWNMGRHLDSWAELATLGPDVALVQEAVPPSGRGQVVYRPIGGGRPWGSAVVGFGTEVTEVTHARGRYNTADQHLHQTRPGSVAIATIGSDARRLTLVSMYGMIDDGYADTTVHRQLSDLVPLLDDPSHEGHTLIGGDLNTTTQWVGHQARYRDWELATFDRIRAFGLVDCLDRHRAAGAAAGLRMPGRRGVPAHPHPAALPLCSAVAERLRVCLAAPGGGPGHRGKCCRRGALLGAQRPLPPSGRAALTVRHERSSQPARRPAPAAALVAA